MAIEPIPLHRDDVDPRPPGAIGRDIDRVLSGLGAPPAPVLQQIHESWATLVGPVMVEHCRPGRLVDGTLHVDVDGPAWASQLRWSQADVVTRITEVVTGTVVTGLAIRVRPFRE